MAGADGLAPHQTRNWINVGLAVAAFVAVCLGVHAILPEPEITGVSPKLRYFAAHQDEFDTVFVGTSRVYHQIAPEIFDRTMAEQGAPTRSFNLGVSGMRPPESFLLLERFLALKPTRLKWAFIEFEEVKSNWDPQRRSTHRLVYWHNWRLTSMVLQKTIRPTGREDLASMWREAWISRAVGALHLKLFAQKAANVGAISDLNDIFETARQPDGTIFELGARRDGYRPAGEPMPPERIPEYAQSLAKEREQTAPQPIDPYAEREYRETARALRQLGAIPIFLVAPSLQQAPLTFREPPAAPGRVISFNDAQRYPQMYDPTVRFDSGHLSRTGAELFTKIFAQEFAAELRAGGIR